MHIRPQLIAMVIAISALLAGTCAPVAAAEGDDDYPGNLRDVYGAYQAVLARREACSSAFPQSRGTIEKAFTSWHARHRKLIDELDQRFTMMIRAASTDERDYARNVGKYEGAILRQREEAKQEILKMQRTELDGLCRGLPQFLYGSDSDLEKAFAEELRIVRKRPLARK